MRTYVSLISLAASIFIGSANVKAQDNFTGYSITERPFEYCPGKPLPDGQCLALNKQWSSRRHQWINFFYRIDENTGKIKIFYRLYNGARDGDTVCFFAIWRDSNRKEKFAFYQRQGINGSLLGRRSANIRQSNFEFDVPNKTWEGTTTVQMGYKECNKTDDKKIAKIINKVAVSACSIFIGDMTSCQKAGEQVDKAIESGDILGAIPN